MTPESVTILSIPELRLCMNVLGFEAWDDLPLVATGEPAGQRLLNAFLHLIQQARFLPVEGGYEMEPSFRQQLCTLGEADRSHRLYEGQELLAFLYEKGDEAAVLTPDPGHPEHCKLHSFSGASTDRLLEWAGELARQPERLRLCPNEAAPGTYEIENSAFFLGTDADTEDMG